MVGRAHGGTAFRAAKRVVLGLGGLLGVVGFLGLMVGSSGCGRRPASGPAQSAEESDGPVAALPEDSRSATASRRPRASREEGESEARAGGSLVDSEVAGRPGPGAGAAERAGRPVRKVAPVGVEVDESKVARLGLRKLSGKRLVLYTDLAADEQVAVLPEVFDQAFFQWCEYFGVDPAEHTGWKMTGFLMQEADRFREAGLLPDDLPPFPNGFSRNFDLWLYEQPSAYYRRELLLHEGTHGFMNTVLGGCGRPWYMEGMAELLGTHRWHEGRVTLNWMPESREAVPMWGRIRTVQDAYAANRAKSLNAILEFDASAHRDNEAYAWSWAAAYLLDHHPRYRGRFRELSRWVLDPDLTGRFRRGLGDDWSVLAREWQVFVAELEYGYDVGRTAVDFTPGQPVEANGSTVRVAADRGWQNSKLRLEADVTYEIRASGRYQVDDHPQIWWCEPGGVSIRYYRGQPLGRLLAAVEPDRAEPNRPCALLTPISIGLGSTITPSRGGTLFLRINDSAAELTNNAGTVTVGIKVSGTFFLDKRSSS